MLFAASVATAYCATCDKDFYRVSSSSVLFFLVLIVAGTVMTRAPFQALVGSGWWALLLAVVANAGLIGLLGGITDRLNRSASPIPERCPTCAGEVTRGGHKVDGLMPTGQDILIFGLFVSVVFLFRSVV